MNFDIKIICFNKLIKLETYSNSLIKSSYKFNLYETYKINNTILEGKFFRYNKKKSRFVVDIINIESIDLYFLENGKMNGKFIKYLPSEEGERNIKEFNESKFSIFKFRINYICQYKNGKALKKLNKS
jgi:hypothetical protein